MKVSIIMGSTSDFSKVKDACDYLQSMGVEFDVRALSAHRTGDQLAEYLRENDSTIDLYIAAAGKAAHLPGVIASHTCKPVIGIPIKSSALDGMDALLSIVQMPPGIPVATIAIDGAKNAAILACQMLAIGNVELQAKMKANRKEMAQQVLVAEQQLLQEIKNQYHN